MAEEATLRFSATQYELTQNKNVAKEEEERMKEIQEYQKVKQLRRLDENRNIRNKSDIL